MLDPAHELTLVTGPAVEPVSVALAKKQARVDLTVDDDLFAVWVPAARKLVEDECALALVDQTWRLVLPGWPACNEIEIPIEPVSAVASVKYYAADGTLATVAEGAYWTWLGRKPPLVYPAAYGSWPMTQAGRRDAVQIEFVAGYGPDAAAVPETAKAVILMTVAYWAENRGDQDAAEKIGLPPVVMRLLRHLDAGGYR